MGVSHMYSLSLITAAYLYVAAASSGCSVRCHILTCVWKLPWLVWLDFSLVTATATPWRLHSSGIASGDFTSVKMKTQQDDLFGTNLKRVHLLRLNSQICLKIPLPEVKGCMGAVTSSNLWLFVPVSHQSATVKASTAGVFTSSTLQILPPPPSAWLF